MPAFICGCLRAFDDRVVPHPRTDKFLIDNFVPLYVDDINSAIYLYAVPMTRDNVFYILSLL